MFNVSVPKTITYLRVSPTLQPHCVYIHFLKLLKLKLSKLLPNEVIMCIVGYRVVGSSVVVMSC